MVFAQCEEVKPNRQRREEGRNLRTRVRFILSLVNVAATQLILTRNIEIDRVRRGQNIGVARSIEANITDRNRPRRASWGRTDRC